MNRYKKWLFAFGILTTSTLAGFLLYFGLEKTKEVPLSKAVKVVKAEKKDAYLLYTEAFGTVVPHRALVLQPEVSGKILEIASQMEVGGIVQKGQVLVAIDPSNYETAVEEARAFLAKAELELKIEQGRKLLAQKEWELLDPEKKSSPIGQELALRQPFLHEKQACLQAAKAKLKKALLDVQRTQLEAPFNALVTEEFVEVGQVVTALSKVASLVSTDEFRIQVSVPYESLQWLSFPEKQGDFGSKVLVIQDLGNGEEIQREGYVLRFLGNLNPDSCTACVLVVLKDPFLLKNRYPEKGRERLPFLLGSRVKVQLPGQLLKQVSVIPVQALREQDKVWVVSDVGTVLVKEVRVLEKDSEKAIVLGLEEKERVIASPFFPVFSGMQVEIE